jgi:septum formation protein
LILASGSPQRRAILEQLGVSFSVVVTDVDELEVGEPEEVAVENARRKAAAASAMLASSDGSRSDEAAETVPGAQTVLGAQTLLGVDTVVALDGRLYGKPPDREHAAATLRALAGRVHTVISGVCVIEAGRERTAAALTQVRFRALGQPAIDWYLEAQEWQGRAGGYAIQGRGGALVDSIDGDYLNVVGLPVATLLQLLPSLLFPAI